MKDMELGEIVKAVEGVLVQGNRNKKIKGVSIDSRTIKADELFIAIPGEKFNGHDFIDDAAVNGAAAFIISDEVELPERAAYIVVNDTTEALQQLAAYYRQQIDDLTVIAITGSAGKTTTKDMIAALLASKYKVHKTQGNFNNYYGLPLTLLELQGDEDIAVLEMGMSSLGEISLLTSIALPQIGVITNVGETHLESLGTIENVAQGKSELIAALPEDGIAILNYDNSYVRDMKSVFKGEKIIYYGFNKAVDISASNIRIDNKGTSFLIEYQDDKRDILIDKPGRHNVYNALAAIAVARELAVGWNSIKKALLSVDLSSLRWDVQKKKGGITIINDSYNANPLSMEAAVDAVCESAEDRVILVLGAMLELGSNESRAHLELGKKIADSAVDVLITVGEIAQLIARGAIQGNMKKENIHIFDNNKQAAVLLNNILVGNDTVLVKGSRRNKMEEIVEIIGGQGG
ncbi:UDP-N-acetylmuramoyl-tripeptide--D-alanyl-D-alanine ligase [Iocasia frigidifontis]|uniref:UDP-N-acetylmuramoyl-tripeptide--D-alanyl-D-alanine ligase n=1 Tax=Iocasia fonsfrigidae TaxID=2682810 RepID=A0A8A7KEF3_9FIRM|nr:UDP-N-acetylmuramoyl-tripeptide--D-alanyl-D-alanine ligase [Iocasia fonsfrigidae]QTL98038.1 UDP-N-acetylmuramoyl-tripeptide--D-alanyl-D-alanine ligase [Iocasia fonsfrigidae]